MIWLINTGNRKKDKRYDFQKFEEKEREIYMIHLMDWTTKIKRWY